YFLSQEEDGIRDFHVTGVQTCALPICEGQPDAVGDDQQQPEPRLAERGGPDQHHHGGRARHQPARETEQDRAAEGGRGRVGVGPSAVGVHDGVRVSGAGGAVGVGRVGGGLVVGVVVIVMVAVVVVVVVVPVVGV